MNGKLIRLMLLCCAYAMLRTPTQGRTQTNPPEHETSRASDEAIRSSECNRANIHQIETVGITKPPVIGRSNIR
jgi:hypothetical protein